MGTSEFYIVSVLARRKRGDKYETDHLPNIIAPADDIRDAKDVACKFARNEFPSNQGWSERHISIVPVTNQMLALVRKIQTMQEQGVKIEHDPSEPNEKFYCP